MTCKLKKAWGSFDSIDATRLSTGTDGAQAKIPKAIGHNAGLYSHVHSTIYMHSAI